MQNINIGKVLVRCKVDGKYLILRESMWPERPDRSQKPDLPGGMVESGETIYEAAIREAQEEAGIAIDEDSLLPAYTYSFFRPDKLDYGCWMLFLVELEQKPEIKLSWEHEAYMWLNAEEVLALEIRDPYPEVFKFLQKSGQLI